MPNAAKSGKSAHAGSDASQRAIYGLTGVRVTRPVRQTPGSNRALTGSPARSPRSIASSRISAMSWTFTSSSLPSPFTPSSIIT